MSNKQFVEEFINVGDKLVEMMRKAEAYPKLVEAVKCLREDLQHHLNNSHSIKGCTALGKSIALLTELNEME